MIKYPNGTEAKIGDAVTLDHGTQTGTVLHLIESKAEMESWNLDTPGLMINTSYGGYVFYPTHSLTDDEIGFISRQRCDASR